MEKLKYADKLPQRKRFADSRLVFNISWIGILLAAILWTGEIPQIRGDSSWVSRAEEPLLYWVIVVMFSLGILYNVIELIRRKLFGLEKCIKCDHLYSSKDVLFCDNCGNVRELNT